MSQPKAIVIGASRGIGQGLVQKLTRDGYEAFGTIRSEPKDDHTFQVDLTDADAASVKAAASNFDSLDLLIVSGAIYDGPAFASISPDEHRNFYNTNVVGPLTAAQAFLPALRKGKQKTIVFITSALASIGLSIDNARRPAGQRLPLPESPYSATKAALNLLGIGLYSELSEEGFSIILVHPGLVRTDMGSGLIEQLEKLGPHNPIPAITVDQSTDGILEGCQGSHCERQAGRQAPGLRWQ
ncbi:unnamed protein product [Tilletia laevis]|uniref:Oxidoreductase n=3 Tax=Tilletia TaxID=13289 RepID=A0A8X7MXF8_9BASI|nr:hypothetical protein CF336_g5288 [Tilletia laevis]KAE8251708.1 hypothetical protein A4X06_0g2567 [Tilletia controversa]KAE8263343.1 hypothetical protein A4X03_0g1755 [Tilletia caries]KAE8197321.1 hypothetical protein CF335_g4643 [Tilletia laevis]CAD6885749.1 unnamed protein product [Tilletia caries]